MLDLKSRKKFFDDIKNDMFSTTSNNPLSSEIAEISTKGLKTFKTNCGERSKRSYELFFDSNLQVSIFNYNWNNIQCIIQFSDKL